MTGIHRLPIRAAGDFALRGEHVHATVGDLAVVVAEIVTLTPPRTWGVFLRSSGAPEALVMTAEIHDEADLDAFSAGIGQYAAVVEKTLKLARQNQGALQRPDRPKRRGFRLFGRKDH